jgi:hypothetical protein
MNILDDDGEPLVDPREYAVYYDSFIQNDDEYDDDEESMFEEEGMLYDD